MDAPVTRYALSGDLHIAYTTLGDGPIDLLYMPTWISAFEHFWDEPRIFAFFERFTKFSRLILFDRRGAGMSDPMQGTPTIEDQMDDVLAVMAAVASERAALFAQVEAGAMAATFAASYPERTTALMLYHCFARSTWAEDMPFARKPAERTADFSDMIDRWGTGERLLPLVPSHAGDPEILRWLAKLERLSAPPGVIAKINTISGETDVRAVLPTIRVPTLVMRRKDNELFYPEHSHYLAEKIPGARYVELAGSDTLAMGGDADELMAEVEEFVTGVRPVAEPDRVLATVMFTDIVNSTRRAAELGDARWRELIEHHNRIVRTELARHRGREVKTMGDGFMATFDGPARAIRSASSIASAVRKLGVEIRAGLHTGELEVMGDDIGGMAVHIGARVGAKAGAGEVLVSSTVKDLVVGSGIGFEDRGEHELKGVPGEWRLYAVTS